MDHAQNGQYYQQQYSGYMMSPPMYIPSQQPIIVPIYNNSNNYLNTALLIDKNGNVGIGTTNPLSNLHVNGTILAKSISIDNIYSIPK